MGLLIATLERKNFVTLSFKILNMSTCFFIGCIYKRKGKNGLNSEKKKK